MFDIAPSEFMLVAFVALVVIGPKDLPKALRVAGYWVGKARGVARQFRQGFDNMVREAELEEMEKRWRAENERIMREHPVEALPAPADPDTAEGQQTPVLVEQPDIAPPPSHEPEDHDRPVMTALPAAEPQPPALADPAPRHADGAPS